MTKFGQNKLKSNKASMQMNKNIPLYEEYNKYFRTTNYKKLVQTDAWNTWLNKLVSDGEWALFACTVVFNPIDQHNTKDRWISDYKNKVLWKFKKRLENRPNKILNIIPFEDFFYFERFEKSKLRQTKTKSPFHIHSLIPIRSAQVNRVWSYDENKLDERLIKDLMTIDVVQNVLIEPVRTNETINWIRYITKMKDL